MNGREVDFDFGHEGCLDDFDEWRFGLCAEYGTQSSPEFRDKATLSEAFKLAILKGIIHRPYKEHQDDLYYLA
jgi:hypothetical protein